MAPLIFVIVQASVTPVRADFHEIQANLMTVAVSPKNDMAFASGIQGSSVYLLSISPTRDKWLDRYRLDGAVVDLKPCLVGQSVRIVVLVWVPTGGLDAAIFDVDSTGKLQLRARASIFTTSSSYVSRTLCCTSNGTFYVVGSESGFELFAFSLENGQRLGRRLLANFSEFIGVVDGAHPTAIYFEYRERTLRAIDVSDPGEPVESIFDVDDSVPNFNIGAVYDSATSGDGRYLFLADNRFGLWAIDLTSQTIIGHLQTGSGFNQVALHETEMRRSLVLTDWENVTGSEYALTLVDATDPRNLAFVGSRSTPENRVRIEFPQTGGQLVLAASTTLFGLDADTLETLWSVPIDGADGSAPPRYLIPFGSNGGVFAGFTADEVYVVSGVAVVPEILATSRLKSDLVVYGTGFEPGVVLLINGIEQRTVLQGNRIRGKKVMKHVAPGQVLRVRVRNALGETSRPVDVTVAPPAT